MKLQEIGGFRARERLKVWAFNGGVEGRKSWHISREFAAPRDYLSSNFS